MKKLILLSLCLVLFLGAKATDIRTLATTAGNLKTDASAYLSTVTTLTVTGTIDARDFKTMRDNMPMLQSLDISAVTVAAYNGIGGSSDSGTDYQANTLPDGAFVSMMGGTSTATSIVLPNSITSWGMGVGIFPNTLTSLTIGNGVTTISNPFFFQTLFNLTDLTFGTGISNISTDMFQNMLYLKALNITSGNPNYSSVEGVLMDKAQTSLLYCPLAKTGNVTIPTTITSIPDLFFSNRTGITSFTPKHSTPANLTLGTTVFDGIDKTKCTLYVPTTKLTAYNAITEWSDFTHKYQGNGLWVETITSTLAKEATSLKIANVNSNIAWTASSNQTWLTLSSGMTGFGALTATVTANTTLSTRQATITIAATGLTPQTITVTQDAGAATLTVDAAAVNIAKLASSTAAVNVTSNTTWTATSDQAWLTVPTGYTGDHSLTFTAVSANPAITTRQAIVTLKATGATDKTITITQAAGDITLSVSATSYAVGKGMNEEGSVQVTSNTNWTASSDQEWCMLRSELIVTGAGMPITGAGNGAFTFFTDSSNPLTTTRTATITLTATGAATKTITVTQAAGDVTLSTSVGTANVANTANTNTSVSVYSNTVWTASSDQAWLTVPSGYTGTHSLEITVTANPTTVARQATVTLKATGAADKTVVVTQAAAAAVLSVSAITANVANTANASTSVDVTSNTAWTATSDQAWLIVPTGYTGDHSLTFTAVSANPAITTRQAIVTLKATGATDKTITITQAAGDITLSVSSATYSVGKESNQEGIVQVTSNTAWSAASDQEWCVLRNELIVTGSGVPLTGAGNGAFTFFTSSANPLTTTRTATITLTATGAATKTITVTQAAGDIIPLLTSSTSLLSNLNYTYGSGPSSVKSFTVAGSSLSGDIIVKPSSRIEISKSSTSGFGSTALTVTQSGGRVDSAPIYVRLKAGLVAATYSDTLYVSSTGAAGITVYARGTVASAPTPQLTTSTTWLDGLNYNYGSGPSAVKSFTVAGSSLTGSIIITPSSNYEISKSSASGFGTTELTITQTTGRVDSARIYVRLKAGLIPGVYSDTLSVSSTGATTKQIYSISNVIQVTVIEEDPHLSCSTYSLSGMNYISGSGPSAVQSFTVGGSTLTSDILVKPSSRIEISTSSTNGFGSTALTVTQSGGRVDSARIYVRLKAGLVAGAYTDTVYVSTLGAMSIAIIVRGAVENENAAQLTVSTSSLTGLNSTYGSGPSVVKNFIVAGSTLTADIIVKPTSRIEISKSSTIGFGSAALAVTQSGGRVDSARIYVRFKAGLAKGTYTDTVNVSTTGALKRAIIIRGSVLTGIPQLTTSTSWLEGLNYSNGMSESTVKSFVVRGTSLNGNIVITPSSSLEISKDSANGFGTAALTVAPIVGKLDSARIYVRLRPGLLPGNYSDALTVSSVGAALKQINVISNVTGIVTGGDPILTSSTYVLTGFEYVSDSGPSAIQSFKVSGSLLTGNIVITPSARYEISKSSSTGFSTSALTITQVTGQVDSARIFVRLKAGLTTGAYNDSLLVTSAGAMKNVIRVYGTVTAVKIYGCTKPSALNYNPLATVDNGSCKFDSIIVIAGCTKKIALNYNPKATIDNGTCQFDTEKIIIGCPDKKATNYNALATVNDGSCEYETAKVMYGCTDSKATNYNPYATEDNNNCIYKLLIPGCTDSLALNYNQTASVNDGSCKYITKIWGCTDPLALNYDNTASHDNGECAYAQAIKGCTDAAALNYNPVANQENGSCIFNQNVALGCIDVHALNYNPFANKDNGSCVYITISDTITGCTALNALNYNPIAMKSDNSQCIYVVSPTVPISGCMSPMALNYNDKAVFDNGSCVFAKPMNLVTIVIPEATVVADTLAKVQEGFCSFNYSIPIDTVYIISNKIVNETKMEVTWGIRQGSLETTVKQVYNIGKDGNTLLYLSLVCKSGTPNSGTRKFAKESEDGSLEAITISSVLKKDDGTTGVSLIQLSNGFKVYPVPVRNEMHIAFDAKENECIQYNVFSVEGMRVSTGQMSFENGQNQSVMNTSTWSPGMYMIQLYRDGRLIDTQKFVKE